jgi:hypothetical protein
MASLDTKNHEKLAAFSNAAKQSLGSELNL